MKSVFVCCVLMLGLVISNTAEAQIPKLPGQQYGQQDYWSQRSLTQASIGAYMTATQDAMYYRSEIQTWASRLTAAGGNGQLYLNQLAAAKVPVAPFAPTSTWLAQGQAGGAAFDQAEEEEQYAIYRPYFPFTPQQLSDCWHDAIVTMNVSKTFYDLGVSRCGDETIQTVVIWANVQSAALAAEQANQQQQQQ